MEQQLVKHTGVGSRDWSRYEQSELLERGKVSGYEGHHINSKSGDLQNAGNPANIRFERAADHRQLHKDHGGTRVPTTGEFIDRTDGGKLKTIYDSNGYSTRYSESYRHAKAIGIGAAISVLSAASNALEVLDYADPLTYIFHVGNAAPEGEGSWLPEHLELPRNSIDENE